MKNGPPTPAVMIPTGNSEEPSITLATESQIIMKDALTIAEVGKRMR